MKTKPILFSKPMVQAILEDRKTQTRRIIKSKHESGLFEVCSRKSDGQITGLTSLDWDERPKNDSTNDIQPLAKVGDILWVRETFQKYRDGFQYKADGITTTRKWKPSIFMPKEACRIFLEVTKVRVERLQDISESDAIAEGIICITAHNDFKRIIAYNDYRVNPKDGFDSLFSAKDSFESLWESINGKESWDANPYVFAYNFKRVEKPKNFI